MIKKLILITVMLLISNISYAQSDSIKIDSIIKTIELKGVTVTAKKKLFERKIDRLVFNVENNISATGLDAYELLKITPNLRVNNDVITIPGKNKLAIMINDRLVQLSNEELINYLKTISSNDIKKIEVITTPPSKYDAEGNSGLINIVLKKITTDNWKATLRSSFGAATYTSYNNGVNFSFKKNKILLQSDINYNNGSWLKTKTNTYNYIDRKWIDNSETKENYNTISSRLNFEYNISKKITTGIQYFLNKSDLNVIDDNVSSINYDNINNQNFNIITEGETKPKNISHSINLYSVYQIDSLGKKLSFDVDYFNFNNEIRRNFTTNQILQNSNSLYSAINNGSQKVNNFSIKTDAEIPLKFVNLSFGGKISYIKTTNDVKLYNTTTGIPVFDPNQSDEFEYNENIQALYFSINKKINKWETQLGIRYENTKTEGNSISLNQINSNNYSKFFPTAYISYVPNDDYTFSLNYSKRLSRPPYGRLNPFKWYNSELSYRQGNPFLQPSFTDNVEFNFNYKNNWNSTLYYSSTKDGYEYITILNNNTNFQETKPFNYYNTNSIGFSQSFNINVFKKLSIYNSLSIYYSDSKSSLQITNQRLFGWGGDFSINCDYFINNSKTIIFNTRFSNIFKGVWDLDRNNSYNQLDASLKFLFFDKNLQITLAGTDLFHSYQQEFISYTNDIQINYKSYLDKRAFRISLIYNFGNNKISSRNKSTGNEDEKNRAR
ncbi:outer membrane beta-barrel family protein [Cloacibacterium caeni]|jgi:hypothetical protein|uniref:outer membrane beta-barrel family protein n=1 Tax=Cloacibacterium caeni TaxID=2004710 RepID=UPI001BCB2A39|nr:outer membrane beta-barrel family protein [Cloacibacterium caeni]HPT08744.1 outer membrane beta-barrel family protein [bacterium]